MTRSFHRFDCEGEALAGTLDSGSSATGLLIVSGGNEVRSGAHAGQARLANAIAVQDFPVFRYDRRGIGDSGGTNRAFKGSAPDIAAAAAYFRQITPGLKRVVGFGNCDAATALAMFAPDDGVDALILANPWVIETPAEPAETPASPPAEAIRARYWRRLKDPRSFIDLLTGKIDLKKLVKGLKKASQSTGNTGLSLQLCDALHATKMPCKLLVAQRDTTALAFLGAWNSDDFQDVRARSNIELHRLNSASHSFADAESKNWLEQQVLAALQNG